MKLNLVELLNHCPKLQEFNMELQSINNIVIKLNKGK